MGLDELGISAEQELIYRALLGRPDSDRPDLARRTRRSPDAVDEALRVLDQLGVLEPDTDRPAGFRVRRPGLVLSELADREVTRLVDGLHRIADLRAEILGLDEVAGQWALTRMTAHDSPPMELVLGRKNVQSRLDDLMYLTRHSVDGLIPLTAQAGVTEHGPDVRRWVRRGVRLRSVVDADFVERTEGRSLLDVQLREGVEVRVVPDGLDRMIILDREVAVVPVEPGNVAAGAVLVRTPVLVRNLCDLFELYWRRGLPVRADRTGTGMSVPRIDERDARILAEVVVAANDEAAADRLHMSVRHVRRRISIVMETLGATNRIHLGALAERHGLIDTRSPVTDDPR